MDQDKLRDILYRHATAARDMGQGLASDIVRLLNGMDEDLVDQITKRYARIEADGFDKGPATTKRIEEMLAGVREVNAKVYQKVASGMTDGLAAIAGHEAEFAARAVKSAGGTVDFKTTIPSAEFLRTLVTRTPLPFSDDGVTKLMPWLEVQEAGRLRRLEGALTKGIGEAQTTGQIVQRIRGTKAAGYTDGILQTSRKDATTIALTANAAIQNAAREATYDKMMSVRYLEWSSILDSRTSEICQGRSGTIYKKGEPHPVCPAHPRCRSMLIPRRDNEGTKHKPYGDWLRDQPESVQDEVLGKARADIFRANPDFDFSKFFKEGGGYRSLDDLRKFDDRLFSEGGVKSAPKAKPAPAPEPEPEKPKRLTSAIDPAVNDNTIAVISRKDATKQLTAKLSAAAGDERYDPRPEFRSSKPEHFGKAGLGAALSDEASSALAALWPELDRITDAFGVPRLRAIRTISSGSSIANMGDGSLGLNAVHFNGYASKVGAETGLDGAALVKARKSQEAMKAELDALAVKINDLKAQYDQLRSDPEAWDARASLAADLRLLISDHSKLAKKEWKLRGNIRIMERQGGADPVSEWKIGDDLKDRPYTIDKYFTGIDKMRTTIYHETGHHIHQMLGKVGRRGVVGSPPLEKKLKQLFFNKFHGAAVGPKGIENKARLTSTYATTNEFEWWAESFSAYFMGRPDLADPDLVTLIEELLDAART